MSKFIKLCKKHKIILLTPEEFDKKHEKFKGIPLQAKSTYEHDPSAALRVSGPFTKSAYIITTPNSPEIVAWHELGHILHPAGGWQNLDWDKSSYGTLINELAASYWAITQNDLPKKDYYVNREHMQNALRTYIKNGHGVCPNNDIFRIYARKLQIEQEIEWKTFNNKRQPSITNIDNLLQALRKL